MPYVASVSLPGRPCLPSVRAIAFASTFLSSDVLASSVLSVYFHFRLFLICPVRTGRFAFIYVAFVISVRVRTVRCSSFTLRIVLSLFFRFYSIIVAFISVRFGFFVVLYFVCGPIGLSCKSCKDLTLVSWCRTMGFSHDAFLYFCCSL